MGIEIWPSAASHMIHRPADIEAKEFAVAWRGYDRIEVRSFLREVALAVQRMEADPPAADHDDRGMLDPSVAAWPDEAAPSAPSSAAGTGPAPETIEVQEFALAWRGYDRSEVRGFLRAIADDVRSIARDEPVREEAMAAFFGRASDDTDLDADAAPDGPPEPEREDEAAPAVTPVAVPVDTGLEAAVLERAAAAAMVVRSDARRASRVMRNGAGRFVDEQQAEAERRRREADAYAAATRAAADRDALAVRTMLTQRSSAALQQRTAAAEPPPIDYESGDQPELRTRTDADLHRLRTDLARAQTSIARLEAELEGVRADLASAQRGAPAQPGADGPSVSDLRRREDALGREEARLATLRTEVEAMQANAADQRSEAERLRLDAQRLRDDAAREATAAATAPDPVPEVAGAPDRSLPASPGRQPRRPISRTAPPGLGYSDEGDDDAGDDAGSSLADMVRDALDAGLDDD